MDSGGWSLHLLGAFRLLRPDGQPCHLRSQPGRLLLGYVALSDAPVTRAAIQELLWPESDGDRQAQSYRRALSDLRQALEAEGAPIVLSSSGNTIALAEGGLRVDAREFRDAALTALRTGDLADLSGAEALYGGTLWQDGPEGWILPQREEYEELFAQVVDQLTLGLAHRSLHQEAQRVARSAVTRAPFREDVRASLVRACSLAGQSTEAVKQFELLEAMLADHWGESPSARSLAALDTPAAAGPVVTGHPVASTTVYVARRVDSQLDACIASGESVVLVHGPRQVGKTLMLARILAAARGHGAATVLTDFQSFGARQVGDPDSFARNLAAHFVLALDAPVDLNAVWSQWLGPNSNLDAAVRAALEQRDCHVFWVMDEADRLFGTATSDDFFGLVRSWHNRRALDPSGPWSRLSIVIAYATEAQLFISDLNQSPFNVGVRHLLEDFDGAQLTELNRQLGSVLNEEEVRLLFGLTAGHPFLSRRAIEAAKTEGFGAVLDASQRPDGPFGEHLVRLRRILQLDPVLLAELRRIHDGEAVADPAAASRLWAGGVIRYAPGGKPEFRSALYHAFLASSFFD